MPFWVCLYYGGKYSQLFKLKMLVSFPLLSIYSVFVLWIPCRIALCNGIFNFKCDTEIMGMVFYFLYLQ